MVKTNWKIRPLRPDEVGNAARFWAWEMGFDLGATHMHTWYRADPDAFVVAVDNQGEIIGTGSAVKQTDSLYLIGTIGVRERHRRKGIGGQILAALHQRSPDANFGLSSVITKLPIFEKMGYRVVTDCYGYAYRGRLSGPLTPDPESCEAETDASLIEIKADAKVDQLEQLAEYDREVRGFSRDVSLTLLDDPSGVVLAAQSSGELTGFGKVQTNLRDQGVWLGPVYADDSSTAKRIFDGLLQRFEVEARRSVYAVVAECARIFAESHSLNCVDRLPRCYVRPEPENLPRMELNKVYVYDCNAFCVV